MAKSLLEKPWRLPQMLIATEMMVLQRMPLYLREQSSYAGFAGAVKAAMKTGLSAKQAPKSMSFALKAV